MFPHLEGFGKNEISDPHEIESIFNSEAFAEFGKMNVMPLIYDEKKKRCNILIYDSEKAMLNTHKIVKNIAGRGRKHPVYVFIDKEDNYIAEVRYGNATANALQRGLWTHTKNALPYFDSLTNGWIDYSHNLTLVKLFGLALVSSEKGHETANVILQSDIDELKKIRNGN